MMTVQQAAQQALDVQDACNLSGVALSFSDILSNVIWPEAHRIGKGTDWVNQHPIVTLFLDKLNSLNRIQSCCDKDRQITLAAYVAVHKLANGEARAAL